MVDAVYTILLIGPDIVGGVPSYSSAPASKG